MENITQNSNFWTTLYISLSTIKTHKYYKDILTHIWYVHFSTTKEPYKKFRS